MFKMLEKLVAVAAKLDKKGQLSEADLVDKVATKLAQELSQEERAQVEDLFSDTTPKATPEQMEARHKEEAVKLQRQKALDNVKRRQREIADFSGLAPKSMEVAEPSTYQIEEVHTEKPKDTALPPRKEPLPTL
jgi:hypothetical protein